MLPTLFPSVACPNYPDQMETLEYYLYKFFLELFAWKSIRAESFPFYVFSSFTVVQTLFQLNFPSVSASFFDISPATIVGHTLLAVQRSH
jgi:hypothetical protein